VNLVFRGQKIEGQGHQANWCGLRQSNILRSAGIPVTQRWKWKRILLN